MKAPEVAWARLRDDARACTRCDLYRDATQTVFGAGAVTARVLLAGEQPGDEEDRAGAPFVGPAGRLLDAALTGAGVDRDSLYVTNVVKHFKWTPRGKRRLHQTPNQTEVSACRPWLHAEVELIAPVGIVALGATAGKALLGPGLRVTRQQGQVIATTVGSWAGPVLVTLHPSAILRMTDPGQRAAQLERLTADLAQVVAWLVA